jgi:large subunit ribosomal protein L25
MGAEMGGRLIQGRRTVAVRCKVADIPEFIEHDVSEMNIGDYILASQVDSSESHKVTFKSDFIVFRLIVPKGIEETVDEEVELDEHGEPIVAAEDGESTASGDAASTAAPKGGSESE